MTSIKERIASFEERAVSIKSAGSPNAGMSPNIQAGKELPSTSLKPIPPALPTRPVPPLPAKSNPFNPSTETLPANEAASQNGRQAPPIPPRDSAQTKPVSALQTPRDKLKMTKRQRQIAFQRLFDLNYESAQKHDRFCVTGSESDPQTMSWIALDADGDAPSVCDARRLDNRIVKAILLSSRLNQTDLEAIWSQTTASNLNQPLDETGISQNDFCTLCESVDRTILWRREIAASTDAAMRFSR